MLNRHLKLNMAKTTFCFCFGQHSPTQSILLIVQAASLGVMFDSSLSLIPYIKLISKFVNFTFRLYPEYNQLSSFLYLVQASISFCLDCCNSLYLASVLPLASLHSVARTSNLGSNGTFSERPAQKPLFETRSLACHPWSLIYFIFIHCTFQGLTYLLVIFILLIEYKFHEEGTLPVLFPCASLVGFWSPITMCGEGADFSHQQAALQTQAGFPAISAQF